MRELTTQEKNEIMELIYQRLTHPKELRPVAVTRVDECVFFDWHDNRFRGWFIDVQYANGRYDIWFVVDISGSLSDDDWHIEKVR